MASAGAQCEHVNHVSTQLPYVMHVVVISFITYLVAGFTHGLGLFASGIISWLAGGLLLISSLIVRKRMIVKSEE